jgi:hypothetical protein
MRTWLAALVAAAGLAGAIAAPSGCAKASDEKAAKRLPELPPPEDVGIPAGLTIAVTIDGAAAPAITAARLEGIKPDFLDNERRAWKLTTILPELDRPGAAVEARGATGVAVRLDRPATAGALEPVLFLTRRGDVVVSIVDPANPFPEYHGQGGRLRRQGDPMPRLSPVTSLAVVTTPPAPAPPGSP